MQRQGARRARHVRVVQSSRCYTSLGRSCGRRAVTRGFGITTDIDGPTEDSRCYQELDYEENLTDSEQSTREDLRRVVVYMILLESRNRLAALPDGTREAPEVEQVQTGVSCSGKRRVKMRASMRWPGPGGLRPSRESSSSTGSCSHGPCR